MCAPQADTLSKVEPKDRYAIVYCLFFTLGLVHTLPWSFFVNANDYWMYKFRNTSLEDYSNAKDRTTLQVEFSPCITISLQISTVTFYLLGLFFGHKINPNIKLIGPMSIILSAFTLITIFIFIDTDNWQTTFFVITMLPVAVINAMSGFFDLSVMGFLGNFPRLYLGSYITGMGLSPIFNSVLQIISLAIGVSTTSSALIYFWTAIAMICCALVLLFLVTTKSSFFKFYVNKSKEKKTRQMTTARIVYLLKKVWPGGTMMALFLLSYDPIHPSISSLVVSENAGSGPWNDKYFVPVITFLLTACTEYVGRLISLKTPIKIKSIYLVIFTAIRALIFVPLIMLCNAQPRHHLSVVFNHDYQFIIIMIFYGLTNGYILSTVNLIIPELVSEEDLEDALQVNAVAIALSIGILSFLPFISVNLI